jgi:uncharacterized repeat protein (TIGR04076 family)
MKRGKRSMNDKIFLGIDPSMIKDHAEYRAFWEKLTPVRITMVEKNEECKHCVGDSFLYKNPYSRPDGVCAALLHVLDLYIWRSALGFPSWNSEDRSVFKIHCPDPKGTVWEMRREESSSEK